jgi:hypothetical protein
LRVERERNKINRKQQLSVITTNELGYSEGLVNKKTTYIWKRKKEQRLA